MNPSLAKFIRSHYAEMQGYVSAGMEVTKDAEKVFLNANENPYSLPGLEGFGRYPEPQPAHLRNGYAQLYGVQPDQIGMTRGADEAIALLSKVFCEPHQDAIVINTPTFGMYSVNAAASPVEIVKVPIIRKAETFILDEDQIIAKGKQENTKLVYLCSPNNPTGNNFDLDVMVRIIKALDEHAVVIMDETYAEFTHQSLTPRLSEFPNLIILRTLSKSYSLAGMRMGSMLCADTEFIALIKSKVMDVYPLPLASVQAAAHVLTPDIQVIAQENIQKILSERKRMETELPKIKGIKTVFESDANFLLIEMERAENFVAYAAEHNYIIRDFSSKPETKDCIRLTIGTPEQNDMVLELLNRHCEE